MAKSFDLGRWRHDWTAACPAGRLQPMRGVAVLFSCNSGERAYETEKLGSGHGLFFHFVLEGLRGEAKNKEDGAVTWEDLGAYVKRQVPRAATNSAGSSGALWP